MRAIFGKPAIRFAIFFVIGAGLTLLAGYQTRFHVTENDFWSVLYYGRHLSWSQLESLYNGFFPIGYAFLIGQLPYAYAIQLSYLINALLAGILVASIGDLVASTRSILATLLALTAAITSPLIFHYANTVGPDIGCAAFTSLAVYLLWKDPLAGSEEPQSLVRPVVIGSSLGLAVLWRNHAIVSSLVILFAYAAVMGRRRLRSSLSMFAALAGLVSVQLLANIASGHGAFETAQNLNVYKLLYGIDWSRPPSPATIEQFSLLAALRHEPQGVLAAYLPGFLSLVSLGWPAAACFLIARSATPISRFGLFALLATVSYAMPVALGDSPRAALTVMSLFICALALAALALVQRAGAVAGAADWLPTLMMMLMLAASLQPIYRSTLENLAFLRENRAQHENFLAVEEVLRAHGMTAADELFSNKYQLYVPNLPPYQPRQIGGWAMDWLWGYTDEYPILPNDSWESFARVCDEQGIRFLVLTPFSGLQGAYFDAIYAGEFDENALGLTFVAGRAKMRIYRFRE